MEAAGSSRSQVLAGTSPPPPTRPPPPARQVSGRASSTSWRKMLCRTHITHPVHTRAEQRAGPGRPRSARVSARPAGTSRGSGNEGSWPAKLSPNFGEWCAGVAAAPVPLLEASPKAQTWMLDRGGGVQEEEEEGEGRAELCDSAGAQAGRRCAGARGLGRARRWRRPGPEEEGRCRCCGRAPVRRRRLF